MYSDFSELDESSVILEPTSGQEQRPSFPHHKQARLPGFIVRRLGGMTRHPARRGGCNALPKMELQRVFGSIKSVPENPVLKFDVWRVSLLQTL
jgi:hypothetical protein